MDRYEKVNRTSKKEIIINNFIGGIAWGFGATIGLAVILSIISFMLREINFVPFVGDFVSQIVEFVNQKNLPK